MVVGECVCVCVWGGVVSDCKFTVAYTVLANNILVCAVQLFGNTENTISIWGYYGEFVFLCLRLCQPEGVLCHTLGVLVGGHYLVFSF